MNKNLTTIYVVRHGESQSNTEVHIPYTERKIRTDGPKGSPLTEKGKQQAKEVAEKLRNVHFDAAFSSHKIRAQDTANSI